MAAAPPPPPHPGICRLYCRVIGAPRVGKTCLLIVGSGCTFPGELVQQPEPVSSRIGFTHTHRRLLNGRAYDLLLLEEASLDACTTETAPRPDIVLVCFAIDDPDSLAAVCDKFAPEVARHCPSVPMLLVGTKGDLRNDESARAHLASRGLGMVSPEHAQAVAQDIGAVAYLECSTLTELGLRPMFEQAIRCALEHIKKQQQKKKKRRCAIM